MNLFLDFDGTVIDSKKRLYSLFSFLVPQSELTFNQYWDLKKMGVGHELILKQQFNYVDDDVKKFQIEWHRLIEEDEWLKYDQPFAGIPEKLEDLRQNFDIYLVTARQFEDRVHWQLSNFGFAQTFRKVFVTKQVIEKQDLILEFLEPTKYDWFVGDTGKDIQAGKILKIKTAAVLNGFRSKEILAKYNPDVILDSVVSFIC